MAACTRANATAPPLPRAKSDREHRHERQPLLHERSRGRPLAPAMLALLASRQRAAGVPQRADLKERWTGCGHESCLCRNADNRTGPTIASAATTAIRSAIPLASGCRAKFSSCGLVSRARPRWVAGLGSRSIGQDARRGRPDERGYGCGSARAGRDDSIHRGRRSSWRSRWRRQR